MESKLLWKSPLEEITKEYPETCWQCPYLATNPEHRGLESFGITDAMKDFCSRFESKILDRLHSVYLKDEADIQCDGSSFQKEVMRIEQKSW